MAKEHPTSICSTPDGDVGCTNMSLPRSGLSDIFGYGFSLFASIWKGEAHNGPEGVFYGILIVAYSVCPQQPHSQEAEGKVEYGQGKVDTYSGPAIFTRELLEAL
jgi:hypothetical protein